MRPGRLPGDPKITKRSFRECRWKDIEKASGQKIIKKLENMDGGVKGASRRPKTNLQMCQVGPKWCLGRQK